MLTSVDKNDVDISKLFEWGTKVSFNVDADTELELYLRILGDADWNRARTKALRASGELRRKLNDKESDEYFAYIPDLSVVETSQLIDLIVALDIRSLSDRVISNYRIEFPKEPGSKATLEEQEKYQQEVDDFPRKRTEKINAMLQAELEKEKAKLGKRSRTELDSIYTQTLINSLCELEMTKAFYDWCIVFGTYKDAEYSIRAFTDISEYENLPSTVKTALINEYKELDLGASDLKK